MKKLFLILALTCVILSGCGKSEEKPNTEENNTSSVQEQKTEITGIAGSNILNITTGLKSEFDIPDGELKASENTTDGVLEVSSSYDIPDGSLSLDYSLKADSDSQLTVGSITLNSNNTLSNEDILEYAKNYLGYSITVPYDSANTDEARTWLEENIINYESQPTTTIGDAQFTLSGFADENGNIMFLTLEISKDDFLEQVTANMEK